MDQQVILGLKKSLFEVATAIYKKEKSIQPMGLIFMPDLENKPCIFTLDYANQQSKYSSNLALKHKAEELKGDAIVIIAETWMVQKPFDEESGIPDVSKIIPSEEENRTSAIVVHIMFKEGANFISMCPVEDGKVIGEITDWSVGVQSHSGLETWGTPDTKH